MTPQMTVAGADLPGALRLQVTDPATGEVAAEAPAADPGQVDLAVGAARRALVGWSADEPARRRGLAAAADAVVAGAAELARLMTMEQGRPLADSRLEVMATAAWLRYWAQAPLPAEVLRDNVRSRIEVQRRPLGVVAALTPWNYPILLAAWKIGPALLAGNCVVLKPSPYAPLTALRLGELLRDCLPPGVLNVIAGDATSGVALVGHPDVAQVSFTGSVATGRQVARLAAEGLKRVTLELGGNDAAVVLPDADPAHVAEGIFWAAFANNGQVCSAIKRVLLPRALAAPLIDALADLARGVVVGDGRDPASQLGPVSTRPQFDRVIGLTRAAVAAGGRAIAGTAPTGTGGFFAPPTLVVQPPDDCGLVAEEQFGPALPLLVYDDVDEAVRRANGTPYGLSGSVWGEDAEAAAAVAERLEVGTAWVNTHLVMLPEQPFGGARQSGIGVENGPWGLAEFSRLQVLHQNFD